MTFKTKPIISLQQFILKQEVKNLYRKIFRTIKQVPGDLHQQDLKIWVRQDFRTNMHITDEISIKMYIKYGERWLNELENSLNLSK